MNLGTLPIEVLAGAVIFALAFLYAFIRGKERIISAILAFYPAFLLFSFFPYWSAKIFEKQGIHMFVAYLGVFLLFYIPSHLIFSRCIESYYSSSSIGKIIQIILLSASFTVLTSVLLVRFLPLSYTISVGGFIGTNVFWFLVAPILAILASVKE